MKRKWLSTFLVLAFVLGVPTSMVAQDAATASLPTLVSQPESQLPEPASVPIAPESAAGTPAGAREAASDKAAPSIEAQGELEPASEEYHSGDVAAIQALYDYNGFNKDNRNDPRS